MDLSELFIALVFIVGLGYMLYIIIRDPILMLKSLLRNMKSTSNWRIRAVFSPIWIPVWIIDKIFDLKIYIDNFEDASRQQSIDLSKYDKYIRIDTDDVETNKNEINQFVESHLAENPDFNYKDIELNYSIVGDKLIIKTEKNIRLSIYYGLVEYITYTSPQNRIFHVKAVLINSHCRENSFFLFAESYYKNRLIGKTYKNKKIYVETDRDKQCIYYNSNIDCFKNFKFNKFMAEVVRLKYKAIKIEPDF
jgi:hypothetical protein